MPEEIGDRSDSSAESVDFNDLTDWRVEQVIDPATNESVRFVYRPRKFIARGRFGKVSRIITIDRRRLAVKEINHSKTKCPEVKLMSQLDHRNLVRIVYHCTKKSIANRYRTYIFMELMPETLDDVIKHKVESNGSFDELTCSVVMYQIFRGLAHMHHRRIAHRDVKPRNVLVHMRTKHVKLCDFGAAQRLEDNSVNVAYVCSRWYRPPELLLQNQHYDCSVDLWSAGCVLGEILKLKELFVGSDSVDQLATIRDMIGAPTKEELEAMKPSRPYNIFPHPARRHVREGFGKEAPGPLLDLLNSLLQYDPGRRPGAWEVLGDASFNVLRSKDFGPKAFPHLFDFTAEELQYSPGMNGKIVPE